MISPNETKSGLRSPPPQNVSRKTNDPRNEVKFGSPPAGNVILASSTVKRPIKFSYGQPTEKQAQSPPANLTPKQFGVKSPGKEDQPEDLHCFERRPVPARPYRRVEK